MMVVKTTEFMFLATITHGAANGKVIILLHALLLLRKKKTGGRRRRKEKTRLSSTVYVLENFAQGRMATP